jgi:hypothetical protein
MTSHSHHSHHSRHSRDTVGDVICIILSLMLMTAISIILCIISARAEREHDRIELEDDELDGFTPDASVSNDRHPIISRI